MVQSLADRANRLAFGYESDDTASFLVLNCDAKVLEYQALMLEHNRIRHILPVDVIMKEGTSYYYYNITSKISLSFFMGRRKLSRKEFLSLLLHIASVVNESAGYLLTAANFVFDPEHVYINPETLDPLLVYIPAALDGGSHTTLQGFISELLMLHINVEGFEYGNLVQRILSEVNNELFHTKSLIIVLNDLLYANCKDPEDLDNPFDTEYERLQSTAKEGRGRAGKVKMEYASPDKVKRKDREISASTPCTEAGRPALGRTVLREKRDTKPDMDMADSHLYSDKIGFAQRQKNLFTRIPVPSKFHPLTVLAISAQIAMGLLIYACRNFLNGISNNTAATYAAVIMIVLAVDVLIFKKLYEAKLIRIGSLYGSDQAGNSDDNAQSARTAIRRIKEVIREENQTAAGGLNSKDSTFWGMNPSTGRTAPEASKTTSEAVTNSAMEAVKEAAATRSVPVSKNAFATEGTVTSGSGKTELLSARKRGARILKSTGSLSTDEDICINKDDFIIGRLADHVDHVMKNNAVGKLHAQIVIRNSVCYIKDLNSVNGTFINGKRIDSNKEVEIRENDRILLANSEFTYLNV